LKIAIKHSQTEMGLVFIVDYECRFFSACRFFVMNSCGRP